MTNHSFSGVITALVTPFTKNDKLDYEAFEKLLFLQLQAKVDGIVLFGTTGEGISLKDHEKKSLLLLAKSILDDKIPIIAGISSPTTYNALHQTDFYNKFNINCLLVTTPFYYKTTETGVIEHFDKVIKNSNCPIMIYNVPSRTNCDISNMPTLLKFFENEQKIVGIKHAGISLKNSLELRFKTILPLFCGNDTYFYELIQNGYNGVVSVFSNVLPKTAKRLYTLILQNELLEGKNLLQEIQPLLKTLESEPNPIPIKYAVSLLMQTENRMRLPLVTACDKTQVEIKNFLNDYRE